MTATEFISRAERYIESARLLLDAGDNESSVSRSYYAMFFAAEAALLTRQAAYSSHRGVIAGFGEHFVKTGVFPASMGRDLSRAQDKRERSDYDATPAMSREAAAELLAAARSFVDRVKQHVLDDVRDHADRA